MQRSKNGNIDNYAAFQYIIEDLENEVLNLLRENRIISFNGFLKNLNCSPYDLNYALNQLAEKDLIEERS